MLNLLPKEHKKKVIFEYRLRFYAIALALTLAGEVIALILLIPPYLTAKSRNVLLSIQSADFRAQSVVDETNNLTEIVRKTNTYLDLFTSTSTPTNVLLVIKNIVDIKGNEVKINGLAYKVQNDGQKLTISGVAKNRQALQDFAKKLKLVAGVVSAELPISDFAKASNIDFSTTIVLVQ